MIKKLKLRISKIRSERATRVNIGKIAGGLGRQDYLTEAQLNHHVHVVGASGFGKTVFLTQIIKQQIDQKKGLFLIDLKSDMETIRQLTRFATEANRASDFQLFSLGEKELSRPYNLIGHGSATQLRDRIMSSLNWSEEFYKNQSASFLLKVLIVLCNLRDVGQLKLHIGTVYRAVNDREFLKELYGRVAADCLLAREAIVDAVGFSKDQANWNSLQGLRSQLESIVKSDFGDLVASDSDGIDLFETVRDGKLLFLFLDTRRYGETAKTIGKFILQDLKSVSARIDGEVPKTERRPFSVIVDEFADLAQEDFIGLLDRARSSKMSIIVSHQEICDLQRISPEFAGRLMGNTSSLYAFLQKRPESAELIAGIAGTVQVRKKTYAHERWLFWDVPTGACSVREVEEFIIHPNSIKSLGVG
ncbi:MAG: TraM recognition domain-containing protein, partial [Bdellovibrionota bacterium]